MTKVRGPAGTMRGQDYRHPRKISHWVISMMEGLRGLAGTFVTLKSFEKWVRKGTGRTPRISPHPPQPGLRWTCRDDGSDGTSQEIPVSLTPSRVPRRGDPLANLATCWFGALIFH